MQFLILISCACLYFLIAFYALTYASARWNLSLSGDNCGFIATAIMLVVGINAGVADSHHLSLPLVLIAANLGPIVEAGLLIALGWTISRLNRAANRLHIHVQQIGHQAREDDADAAA